jgi:NADH-quinone oxidoreductase subunit H
MGFALFFIGEYANMILMSMMSVILFMGGWLPPLNLWILHLIPGTIWLGIKLSFILFLFIAVRAAYPRYRYDQLMRIGWKVFLPLSLGWVVFISSILLAFDGLPG